MLKMAPSVVVVIVLPPIGSRKKSNDGKSSDYWRKEKKKKGKCVVGGKVGISGEKIGQNLGSTIIFTHKFTFNH